MQQFIDGEYDILLHDDYRDRMDYKMSNNDRIYRQDGSFTDVPTRADRRASNFVYLLHLREGAYGNC